MLRVLIVDSMLAFREALIQNLLAYLPEGSRLEQQASSLNMRDKLASAQPDVVIIDTNVPDSGDAKSWLARQLSAISVPVIFYSSRMALRGVALSAGAVEFVLKPPLNRLNDAFYQRLARIIENAAGKKKGSEAGDGSAPNPMYIPPKGGVVRKQSPAEVGAVLRSMRLAKPNDEAAAEEDIKRAHGVLGRSGANRSDVAVDMRRRLGEMKEFAERLKQKTEATQLVGGFSNPGRHRIATPAVKVEEYKGEIAMIAMGASTGGTEALSKVLSSLRPPLPGIVVVQHIPQSFSQMFAERLERECAVHVKEAETGDRVECNNIYIAPGGKHMRVHKVGNEFMIECLPGPKVHGVCPSADILFDSVAEAVGGAALGVILTGMGRDGAEGMLHMRQQGSRTLGQDEASCIVYGMPRAAWECGAVARQVSLNEMAGAIMDELPGK